MHVDSDGYTNYDGEDDVAPRCRQAAVTPKSAAFGSPVPVDPWTGGLPAQPVDDHHSKKAESRRCQRERKAKPSFFDAENDNPSEHDQDEEELSTFPTASNHNSQQLKPLISSSSLRAASHESSDPFHPSQKTIETQLDNVDSTIPKEGIVSDSKGTSPAPRLRAAMMSNGDALTTNQTKKKGIFQFSSAGSSLAIQPSDPPRDTKLTDAMRGTSVMAPTQESQTKTTSKQNRKRNGVSNQRSKLTALNLEDSKSADRDDPFDTTNVPLSQGASPGRAKPRTTALTNESASKPKQTVARKSKQAMKSKPAPKPSLPAKQGKLKRPVRNVRQKADSIMGSATQLSNIGDKPPQPGRRTRQQGRAPIVEAGQDPIVVSSGSSLCDSVDLDLSSNSEDGDYIENGKPQRVEASGQCTKLTKWGTTGSKQPTGEREKRIKTEEKPKLQKRSPDPAKASSIKDISLAELAALTVGDDSDLRLSMPATQGRKSNNVAPTNLSEQGTSDRQNEAPLSSVKTCGPEARKPTIIPFDAGGPKSNGVSRTKSTSKSSQTANHISTGPCEYSTAATSLRPSAAPESSYPCEQSASRNIENGETESNAPEADEYASHTVQDDAVNVLASGSMGSSKSLQDSYSAVPRANGSNLASGCSGQEADPSSDDRTDMENDDKVVLVVDNESVDEFIGISNNVVPNGGNGPPHEPKPFGTDGGHQIHPRSNPLQRASQILQNTDSTKAKARLKRSLPPDEAGQLLPSSGCRTFPNPVAAHGPRLNLFPQTTDISVERTAKKLRLCHMETVPFLKTPLPRLDQQHPLFSTKNSSAESSASKRRNEPETTNGPLNHIISIESDDPEISQRVALKLSRVHAQGVEKTQREPKPASKKDIAKQFLADMATRSTVKDRGDAFQSMQKEHLAVPTADVPWSDDHADHRNLAFARRLSDRERVFKEIPVTTERALVEVMHRIVGVSPAF